MSTKAMTQTAGRGIRNRPTHYKETAAIKLLLRINNGKYYLLLLLLSSSPPPSL
jgi:hypothetical protein